MFLDALHRAARWGAVRANLSNIAAAAVSEKRTDVHHYRRALRGKIKPIWSSIAVAPNSGNSERSASGADIASVNLNS